MAITILGTGSYLPPSSVANTDIAKTLDTSDEWIYTHTGIQSRHIAGPTESTSSLAAEAARAAMVDAKVTPGDIGLVILATSTPDFNPFPATACIVQEKLGCTKAGAFDIQAACTGFICSLEMARGYVTLHPDQKVLVIGAECLSRILDWSDRSSCILFGDGAGAVVVGEDKSGKAGPSVKSMLGANGGGAAFISRTGGTRKPPVFAANGIPKSNGRCEDPCVTLMGHEVFAFAVRTLAKVTTELCGQQGVTPDDLDRIFAHQANRRIIEATARRMDLPLEKFYLNLETTANTSAASIPIALDQAVRSGELKDGMRIVMAGFGSGLTYGGLACTWPYL